MKDPEEVVNGQGTKFQPKLVLINIVQQEKNGH